MMRSNWILVLGLFTATVAPAQSLTANSEPTLQHFHPVAAPVAKGLLLKRGDRLAICGDSITEQKMYSRIMEDYLTMCVPQLQVTVRQYGWSGERAPGFLARMTNDCLRFDPTVATTCYGMNDHEYRPFEDRIGQTYRQYSLAIDDAFKAHHVRVVEGSAGCVGKIPHWVKTANGTVEDLNLNLCNLRNIGLEVAQQEKIRFADVFWPMLTAGVAAQRQYGTNYAIAGKDGVHPGWAGHTIMAYAFLKALGLNGDIGTFTVDLRANRLKASAGHKVLSGKAGEYEIRSSRYPFCACLSGATGSYPSCDSDNLASDSSIRSAMQFVPFNHDLNRFMLVAHHAEAGTYKVTWGNNTRTFTAGELSAGVNLAEAFPCNPFSDAFSKVDGAIAAKQAFETHQIKQLFRSPEAKANMAAVVQESEQEHGALAEAVRNSFVPVTYTLRIVAE